jgi:uncharacterized protein
VRLVLDTNVLIAAFATEGACMRLYRHCARRHTLVSSERLIGEFEEKLVRKLKIALPEVGEIVASYRAECIILDPSPPDRPISRDPDDDWVLMTALEGRCECIVSGDADLWSLGSHDGIRIVQPREFWDFEATHGG